jgi:hypothetical protein
MAILFLMNNLKTQVYRFCIENKPTHIFSAHPCTAYIGCDPPPSRWRGELGFSQRVSYKKRVYVISANLQSPSPSPVYFTHMNTFLQIAGCRKIMFYHLRTRTNTHAHTHTHISTHIHTHTHTHTHAYPHTYTHIHTHTHTHTHTLIHYTHSHTYAHIFDILFGDNSYATKH